MPTCFFGLSCITSFDPTFVTLELSVTNTKHSEIVAGFAESKPVSGDFLNKSSTRIVAPFAGLCLSVQEKFLQVGPGSSYPIMWET